MNESLALAQEQVREIVRELRTMESRLVGAQANLPPSAGEADRLRDLEEMDPATKLRSDIDCVLSDSLRPAIRALEAAVESTDRGPREPSGRQEDDPG